jgi:hypothetical protein
MADPVETATADDTETASRAELFAKLEKLGDPGTPPQLHRAVIAGNPDLVWELRRAGAPSDETFLGWTPLDLAFAVWDHATEGESWSDEYDPRLLEFVERTPHDPALLDQILDALMRPLPADEESTKLIEAWFAAASSGDANAAMKLGTPAWVQEERDWKSSFSRAVFRDGVRFDSHEITGAETEGDLIIVAVSAVMRRPDGTTDREGMTFKLQQFDKELLIVELR